jgi:predicted PurR-regulated permease PerM
MRTFSKAVVWAAALFVGLFIWNVTPDFRPLIAWVLAAAFLCYVLSTMVEVIVRRLVCGELQELWSRVDVIDRKVTAILRDALEQRRLRGRA